MNLYLLDAGGPVLIFGVMIIFILAAILVEGAIMILMKYNAGGKAFLNSFLINLGSLLVGYLLSSFSWDIFSVAGSLWPNWFLLFVITIVIEFLLLLLLNRNHPASRTFFVCIVINIVSYIILLFFVKGDL